jgi:hypothetical protein
LKPTKKTYSHNTQHFTGKKKKIRVRKKKSGVYKTKAVHKNKYKKFSTAEDKLSDLMKNRMVLYSGSERLNVAIKKSKTDVVAVSLEEDSPSELSD